MIPRDRIDEFLVVLDDMLRRSDSCWINDGAHNERRRSEALRAAIQALKAQQQQASRELREAHQ